LTNAVIGDASSLSDAILHKTAKYPNLVDACYISASYSEAWLLNQLMRCGRQSAYERVAHLVMEIHHRLSFVGLANGKSFAMPLTQEVLADALGLSIVHLNRTLQQLRREGMIAFKSGVMHLLKPEELKELGDFRLPQVTAQRNGNEHAA
jgi:CRP-like cAMP-binding protein